MYCLVRNFSTLSKFISSNVRTLSGAALIFMLPIQANAVFVDASIDVGLDITGAKSFGNPSWVDFNDDGWLDMVAPHHSQGVNFYKNNNGTSFVNVTDNAGVLSGSVLDRHGYAWADFDNDGDMDFFVQLGRFSGSNSSSSELWKNNGDSTFSNITTESITSLFGRTTNWLDYDNDGLLDLLVQYEQAVRLFKQNKDKTFTEVTVEAGLDQAIGNFMTAGSVADFDKDGDMDIFIGGGQKDQLFINDGAGYFSKVFFSTKTHSKGMAWGDYDNDGDLDLYVARGTSDYYQALVWDASSITFSRAIFKEDSPQELTFRTTGQNVTFKLIINQNPSPKGIQIGVEKANPATNPFTLSSASAQPVFVPGTERSFYVWQDDTQLWHVQWSNNGGRRNFYGEITSDGVLSEVVTSYTPFVADKENHLYRNDDGVFVDVTQIAGINISANNYGAVWGDYDNDEDLDLYVVDVGNVKGNKANHLFTNNGDGTFTDLALEQNVEALDAYGRHYGAAWGDYDNDGALDLFLTQGFGWGYPGSKGKELLYRNQGNANHWLKLNLIGVESNRSGMGAHVMVQTATAKQWRHNNGGGGGQLYSQGSGPLHFGLGANTKAKNILIKWPSGNQQFIWQVPGDQFIDVYEKTAASPYGVASYQPGVDEGVFVWKDSFDGPYYIRTNGAGVKTNFKVKLVSSKPVMSTAFHMEPDDVLTQSTYGFSLYSNVASWHDGVDVEVAAGAKTLLSVVQDGVANPRQVHVGRKKSSLSPAGWILPVSELPLLADFTSPNKAGLFIGFNPTNNLVEARYTGTGVVHRQGVSLISSKAFTSITARGFEPDDLLVQTANSASLAGYISSSWDGVDVTVDPSSDLGLRYSKDDIFQPRVVNQNEINKVQPNAYELPLAEPYGEPLYDAANESGLFVWKDKSTGLWHIEGTAGTGFVRYKGVISSSIAFTDIKGRSLESGDVLDFSDPLKIVFDIQMSSPWQDGFEFKVPAGAKVQLTLTQSGSANPADALKIGAERWDVKNVPVDISGWK